MRQKCDECGLNSVEMSTDYNLGDLITIIHSYHSDSPYDNNPNLDSNCLAYYFLNIGGRQLLNDTIHSNWLNVPSNQSLGGDYGCHTAYNFTYDFKRSYNQSNMYKNAYTKQITNDNYSNSNICYLNSTQDIVIPNAISSLTAAEFYKRMIMIREEPKWAYPNISWIDVQQLLYGSDAGNESILFPNLEWGGASTDMSIYIQTGVNISQIEQQSHGNWRIFSKLGGGMPTNKNNTYDIAYNGYACFPIISQQNGVEMNQGVEFILSLWYEKNGQLCDVDASADKNVATVVKAIVNGHLR